MKTKIFELKNGVTLVITSPQELNTAAVLASMQQSVVEELTMAENLRTAMPTYKEFADQGFAEIVSAVTAALEARKRRLATIETMQDTLTDAGDEEQRNSNELDELLKKFGAPPELKVVKPPPPSTAAPQGAADQSNGAASTPTGISFAGRASVLEKRRAEGTAAKTGFSA